MKIEFVRSPLAFLLGAGIHNYNEFKGFFIQLGLFGVSVTWDRLGNPASRAQFFANIRP